MQTTKRKTAYWGIAAVLLFAVFHFRIGYSLSTRSYFTILMYGAALAFMAALAGDRNFSYTRRILKAFLPSMVVVLALALIASFGMKLTNETFEQTPPVMESPSIR